MRSPCSIRLFASVSTGMVLAAPSAEALMRWNEGKDQIHVTASVSAAMDSNIYTSANSASDFIYTGTLGMEYRRQAGLIGVNADLGLMNGQFSENTDENFLNPTARIELTKDTGRTTGTLSFNGMRSSRADPAANVRTDSWNYGTELNVAYPISERHHVTGSLGWSTRDYRDNSALVDLTTSVMSADWFYVYSPERDIFGGYRLRISETSALSTFADHSISGGISGRILPKLNGTVRVGYQVRNSLKGNSQTFNGYNATGAVTWNLTRKASLRGNVSKDFSTTSTNVTTDTLSAGIDGQYARSAKLALGAGVSMGINKFLGLEGGGREDTYFSYYGSIRYTFSERLRVGLSYSYYRNWSTLDFADFDRQSLTFDASTRF